MTDYSSSYNYQPLYNNPANTNYTQNLPPGAYQSAQGAYARGVQGNELVSNQLNGLLADNSRYMQLARQSGYDSANARGLLNSTGAAGSAQRAAIQAGLPIAQGDASAYQSAAGQNLDALNSRGNLLSQLATQRGIATSDRGARVAIANANNDAALQRQRENLAYSGEQEGLSRQQQIYLQQMQNHYGLQQTLGQGAIGMMNNYYNAQYDYTNQAANNPYAIQNPQAFQGFFDFMNQGVGADIGQLFNQGFYGGY